MKTVAVTGTNGKTSTIAFAQQILDYLKIPNASIGTRGIVVNGKTFPHLNAEPDASLISIFSEGFRKQGIKVLLIEAHSSAIINGWWNNCSPEILVFTGLGRDHLDVHGTIENYWLAKKKLFELSNPDTTIISSTDSYGKELISEYQNQVSRIITCGVDGNFRKEMFKKDFFKSIVNLKFENISRRFELSFFGEQMIDNLLFSIAIMTTLKIKPQRYLNILNILRPPRGRYETIKAPKGIVVLDYAHTPDALENILNIIKPMTVGQIHLLFGCGGDRDRGKRKLMGAIALKATGKIFITDDNPRNEDPEAIRNDILSSCQVGIDISNRKKAIDLAVSGMQNGDSLLVLGKGDEDFQTIKDKNFYFSDREHVEAAIKLYQH